MPVFDLPTLLNQRVLAIYKNGLKLIVPDTASTPLGKLAHGEGFADNFVESALNRITDNHRLNQREWTADTPTYGLNTKTYENGETCVKDDIIYQNQSGGTLPSTDVPGVNPFPISGWFPLTGGGTPTFNIPFWNDDGIIQVGGVPVNAGAVAYAHQVIVRAQNGLYQRNDITNPPPVSTNFLTEFFNGQWIYIGEFVSLPRADFNLLYGANGLLPNRIYYLNDVVHPNGTGVWIPVNSFGNYNRDGYIIADYTVVPQQWQTLETEYVKYDPVNDVFLERIDNHGNHAIQTLSDVNSSGNPSNSIDGAPWGCIEFENNKLINSRFSVPWVTAQYSKIDSFRSNDVNNTLINNPLPNVSIAFNSNKGFNGTLETDVLTTIFEENEALNGGTVITPGGNLSNSKADGVSCINRSPNSIVTGINSSIAAGASRGFCHGAGASIGASAVDAVAIGTSAGVAANAVSAIAIGSGANASITHAIALGDHAHSDKQSAFTIGKYGIGNINNQFTIGWAQASDLGTPGAQLQTQIITVGVQTTSNTPALLVPLHGVAGTLIVPSGHSWSFTLDLSANYDILDTTGTRRYSRWYLNGSLYNDSGVITYNDIVYQDATGAWTAVAGGATVVPLVRFQLGAAMGGVSMSSTGNDMEISVTGIVGLTPINWKGSLLIEQNGHLL